MFCYFLFSFIPLIKQTYLFALTEGLLTVWRYNSISSSLPYHCSQQEHGNLYVQSQWQLLLVYHYLYMVSPLAELSTSLISPRFTACLSVYKGMGQGHMFSRGVDGTVIWGGLLQWMLKNQVPQTQLLVSTQNHILCFSVLPFPSTE